MAKSYSSAELIKMAKANGWTFDHATGSHHIFTHPTKPGHVNIPHPRKDLPIGTARSILKQIGVLP
jgi:predicted RNA binding protein YcfA (HicA-like mRNA interferase family)